MRIFFAKKGDQYVGTGDFLFAGRLYVQNRALNNALETERGLGFGFGIFGNNGCVILGKAGELVA